MCIRDRVRALELGGDDFLTKPYNHKVLLARIMANIRRVQMDAAEPSVSGYHLSLIHISAKPGDIIILSPASASFDLYPNFEVRGREFKNIVCLLYTSRCV